MIALRLLTAFLFAVGLLSCGVTDAYAAPAAKKASTDGKTAEPKLGPRIKVPADMQGEIDRFCAHEAKTLGGYEYEPQRQIACGQLSSCLGDCYVVLYLIEGVPGRDSNNNVQYIAAFTYNAGKPILLASTQFGGRGLRYGIIKSVGPDAIKLSTEYYLPKDPMSTPSGRGHASFVVASKHIIETP